MKQKYNRLTVLGRRSIKNGNKVRVYLICRCDCGKTKTVLRQNVIASHTKSCGCWHREATIARSKLRIKHGNARRKKRTGAYESWAALIQRCTNSKHPDYRHYGYRSVRVHKSWLGQNGFERFLADMGPRPANTSLDRIDNGGNYEPGNCRWTTQRMQTRNSRHCHQLSFRGKVQCMTMWAEEIGLNYSTLRARINEYGWPAEKALTTPVTKERCRVRRVI